MTTSEPIAPTAPVDALLTDEMLARFDERAPQYDRDNRFFEEDLAELRASGYLSCALPTEYGGAGLGLLGYTQLARRLGYVAPATALGVNMHIYWTGLAADLLRMGDDSCRFILERAAEGEVFAAIHGEPGNDMPLLLSTTTAERVDGGWNISGHKIFGSMTPVWTYGGFHAMDSSDPEHPQIVHGFLPRDTPGIDIVDTWDTLGMRVTQSQDTILDQAFCPDELCPVVCPAGFAGAGPFHVAIFAWALTGLAIRGYMSTCLDRYVLLHRGGRTGGPGVLVAPVLRRLVRPAPADDRAEAGDHLLEPCLVLPGRAALWQRVVRPRPAEDPVVQPLPALAEPLAGAVVGACDVPVNRCRDARDDLAHVSLPASSVEPCRTR